MSKTSERFAALAALGFDSCTRGDFPRLIRIGCSQCAALAINGVATHERGCPNAMHECNGCSAIVPANVRYCGDCR